jgi:hypothetical protein
MLPLQYGWRYSGVLSVIAWFHQLGTWDIDGPPVYHWQNDARQSE